MYKKITVGIIVLIIFIGTFYFTNYYQTIDISDNKMIAKAIMNRHPDKYGNSELINIVEGQFNKKDFFVLFQYGDEPYSLAIFEEASFGNKKRYKYSGGSSQSSKYGSFKYSKPVKGGYEVLTVVYGDNNFMEVDYFTLSFINGKTIKQVINKGDFLHIFRFYSSNTDNGNLKFHNKREEEI